MRQVTMKDESIVCPECKMKYIPDLAKRPNFTAESAQDKCVQNIWPEATVIQREQIMTGLCSAICWDKYLGVGLDDAYQGPKDA